MKDKNHAHKLWAVNILFYLNLTITIESCAMHAYKDPNIYCTYNTQYNNM